MQQHSVASIQKWGPAAYHIQLIKAHLSNRRWFVLTFIMIERVIPKGKAVLPVIGLGTWQAFDVSSEGYSSLRNVIGKLQGAGGKLIDTSPMYGRAEEVVGNILGEKDSDLFLATKVWTRGKEEGISQMEASRSKLRREVIDLIQIHNLVDWKTHLGTLREWQQEGKVRYVGITHYTASMHGQLEEIIRTESVDFAQFNYSITDLNAENRLLPAAAEHGVATLINRPFGEGALFAKVKGKALPAWSKEWGIRSWAQFVLKFILSHPAVTCVIPGTGDPAHAADNMDAGTEPLPDASGRQKMADYIRSI